MIAMLRPVKVLASRAFLATDRSTRRGRTPGRAADEPSACRARGTPRIHSASSAATSRTSLDVRARLVGLRHAISSRVMGRECYTITRSQSSRRAALRGRAAEQLVRGDVAEVVPHVEIAERADDVRRDRRRARAAAPRARRRPTRPMKSPKMRTPAMRPSCTSSRTSISPAGKRRARCTLLGGFSP